MQTRVSVQPVEATDDAFWDQFWADTSTTVQDVFALVPAAEIRAVREESPSNLATLCYKVRCSTTQQIKHWMTSDVLHLRSRAAFRTWPGLSVPLAARCRNQ